MPREIATILWLQLYFFVDINKEDLLHLKVSQIEFQSVNSLSIKLDSKTILIDKQHFPHLDQVCSNFAEFCRAKQEDDMVFSLKKGCYNAHLDSYFPLFNLTNYISFIASVHLQKFLQDPRLKPYSEKEKELVLTGTKFYIIEYLASWKNIDSVNSTAEQYVTVTKQVKDLKKMLKKLKRGHSIPLISKEQRMILESQIEFPDEKKMEEKYQELVKKKKKHLPSFDEWKEKEVKEFEARQREQKEVQARCEILFDQNPTVEQVEERMNEYRSKLKMIDGVIQNFVSMELFFYV